MEISFCKKLKLDFIEEIIHLENLKIVNSGTGDVLNLINHRALTSVELLSCNASDIVLPLQVSS